MTEMVYDKMLTDPAAPFEKRLRILCGFVQNDSDVNVQISQDDATRTFIVRVGERRYYGNGMMEAFEHAFQDPANDPLV